MSAKAVPGRNVRVSGKRTSMRLEPEMWEALYEVAKYERCTVDQVCTYIASQKNSELSLSSATRVFLMLYYKNAVTEEGRKKFHGHLQNAIREANDNFNAALREMRF